jgi:hypothetical protein
LIKGRARFDQPTNYLKCIIFPRTYLWSSWFEGTWTLRVLSIAGPSAGLLRTVRRSTRPSVPRRRTVHDAQYGFLRPSLGLCLPLVSEVVMVTLRVSPPSGFFSATTFLQEILLFPWSSHALPMIISLPLPLSAMLGRIRTLLPSKLITFTRRALYPPAFPEILIVPH